MEYYLIDLENVGSQGIWGADLLEKNSCIIIFYSSEASTVDRRTEGMLLAGSEEVCIQNVNVHTKNAMDFAIAVKAGELLKTEDTERVVIVSNDNGYQAVLEAGNRERPGIVSQYSSVLEAWYLLGNERRLQNPKCTPVSVKTVLQEKKTGYTLIAIAKELDVDVNALTKIIRKANTHKEAYTEMLHAFGREKGLLVYRRLQTDGLL